MPTSGRKSKKSDQKKMKEIIHSGHFMVSDIDDPEVQDGEESPSLVVHESDCEQEDLSLPEKGFNFESACKETSKTYTFGSRSNHSISIDASLTKLFECMTLAYSGKLTSPRWKQFKGLKLRLKEKIRLNNMIWRAWHMQFVMKIKTAKLCQFATPLDGDTHMKAEAVVIEGTYWKRRMANITAEYQKWRLFSRDRFRSKHYLETENMDLDMDSRWPTWPKEYSNLQSAMDEDFLMDFTDTLFTTFNPSQPFDFPNPREIAAKAGIADFIQPGLVQLQPPVDDFMDTLEPLSDLFSDFLNSKLPPLPEESAYTSSGLSDYLPSTSGPHDNSKSYVRSSTANVFSQLGIQRPSSRRSASFKKSPVTAATKQQPFTVSSHYPLKPLLNSLSSGAASEALLQDVPLMSSEQLPTQASNILPFPFTSPQVQTTLESAIVSFLKEGLQTQAQSMQQQNSPLQVSGPMKRERKTFFQQFASKSFDETQVSQQAAPIQMALQSMPQRLDTVANTKPSNQPLYFSVTLNNATPSTNFKVPSQGSNISPNVYPVSIGKQAISAVTQTETPAFRRHSYTTGQQHNVSVQSSGDYMGTRRSRPIAPAAPLPNVGSFAVPEVPQSRRARSRSVSSPQSGSPKPYFQQPSQALSLTDISSAQQLILPSDSLGKRILATAGLQQNVGIASTNVLQQNAILAQLLSPGCSQQDVNQNLVKVTNATTPNVTAPVTIIRPVIGANAHTFVFSHLPMAAASSVPDLANSSIQAASNPTLRSQDSSPSRAIPSPESPCSSTSSSPAISSVSFESSSPGKSIRIKSDEEKIQYKEHRRVCHINAEQKRRCNIKNGFEQLHHLLPSTGQTPSSKVSKAAMLQRGAEHIRTLKSERQQQLEEVEQLKKQIEELNNDISMYQSQLPASGAPIPCQRNNRIKEQFAEYTRQKTLQNWKYYILSLILESLVDSYNTKVSTASYDELFKTTLSWLDENCSLMSLRPNVLNSLRHLSTTTSILSHPSRVPDEVIAVVTKKENRQ